MPITPFHVGPGATLALPLRRVIDFPVFILSNFVVDLEPLAVIVFGLNCPEHMYFHTFLFGSLVGVAWALVAYPARGILKRFMGFVYLDYSTTFVKVLFSALLGVWFHVLLDAPLYSDIRPFYPLKENPMYGLVSLPILYLSCIVSFIPAFVIYVLVRKKGR
jgi:membrane-bound metal-dependent hydrolase YbcI (DUF457 family)